MSVEEDQGCIKMKIIEYHDYKTLMGPCFISFSIPLLVPGVVLTVVGSYGNESSFPTFGAWHIAGISILSLAILLLISGIVLKCCYQPVISADIEQHLSPTSSMIAGSKNLGYENDIYSSKSGKLNNKVSHHDSAGLHRMVSTHESKTTNTQRERHNLSNNNASDGKGTTKGKVKSKEESEVRSNNGQKNESSPSVVPPPSYADIETKSKRKKRQEPNQLPESNISSSVARTMDGQVQVTANIIAEAEFAHTSGSRDISSDGGTEKTKFLPEKKRKKKKKHKRNSNLSQQSVPSGVDIDSSSVETSARQVLPELRAPPILNHEGAEHHHHNLHVHFKEGKEDSIIESKTKPSEYDQDFDASGLNEETHQ